MKRRHSIDQMFLFDYRGDSRIRIHSLQDAYFAAGKRCNKISHNTGDAAHRRTDNRNLGTILG